MHRVVAASEYVGEDFDRHAVRRKRRNGERGERLSSHGVDVGQRVGGCDAAKGVWVIDDGREEVHRLNEGNLVGQRENTGIVECLPAYEEPRVSLTRQWCECAREVPRTHLGGSTRAPGERGESEELLARP